MPYHLLLPLLASILFVFGLMFSKRASALGVNAWTVTFCANQWAALVFSVLWLRDDPGQPWTMLWQPLVIGVLYILGQGFTFLALERGDVSIATPVFSVKVISVAALVALIDREAAPRRVWLAALLATAGIALVQSSGLGRRHTRVVFTVVFASLAALTFSLFDVIVQVWSPAWGAGRLLPLSFTFAAVMSLAFLPLVDLSVLRNRQLRGMLLVGTLMIGLQALCIVFTLGVFGDAARVNIVYALRGLWGVVLAWLFARVLHSGEANLGARTMGIRLAGAGLLTAAVVLAIT